MRLSIRWKLLLSISLPLLLVYTIMLMWDYQRVREGAIDQVQSWVLERAQSSANAINTRLDAVSQSAENVSMMLTRGSDAGDLRMRFGFGLNRPNPFAYATHLVLEAADGTPTVYTQHRGPNAGRSSPQPLVDDADLQTLYDQLRVDLKPHWSSVRTERRERQMLCTYAEPIVQSGKLRGAVMIDINVNDLVRNNRSARGPSRNQPTTNSAEIGSPTTSTADLLGGLFRPTTSPTAGVTRSLDTVGTILSGSSPPEISRDPFENEPPPRNGSATRPSDGFDSPPPRDPGEGQQRRFAGMGQWSERLLERRENRRGTTQPSDNGPFRAEERDSRYGGPPDGPPIDEAAPTTGTSLDPDANAIELIDRDGRPITMRSTESPTHPRSVLQWADEHDLPEFTKAFRAAQNGESGIARVAGLADVGPGFKPGESYWIAMAPIKETGWVYSAAIPESQVIGPLMERLQQRALFLAAGLVVILIVAMVVAFRLSRPIEHMAGAVRELAGGNLDARVTGVTSQDELGQLARAFNHMTGQLKAHVQALTEQTAVREKAESELRIARQIQTDLLPRTFPPFPDRPEFDLHAVNIPAAGVAGDFYDFFFVADDWLTLVIADVSGKGVPAALLMAVTRTIVRNLALAGLPLEQICERANEMLLADTNNNMFVTMFLAQYHPKTGRLRYVNAGHPRPYIFVRGGEVQHFGSVTSPLLGVCEVCEIGPVESAETVIEIGQTLLLYTDGVTEAQAADRKMLRDAGAMKLVHEHDGEDVATFCASMVAAIDAYQDHHPADDITILALRRRS